MREEIVQSGVPDDAVVKEDDGVGALPLHADRGFVEVLDVVVEELEDALGFFFADTDEVLFESKEREGDG